MDRTAAERIAKRFVSLSLDQRKQILGKMVETGQSFRLLPIMPTRQEAQRIPLSYAQQRLLFLWQMEPDGSSYNVPMAVRLHGRLDERAMARALVLLVERHESLRTRFVSIEGEFYQEILQNSPVTLEIVSFAAGMDEAALQAAVRSELARPFDLLQGPLLRARLLRLDESDYLLTLCMHHIVSDGWSGEVMVTEFIQLYRSLVEGLDAGLAELPIQYADYAIWQRAWLEAGEGQRQLDYWKSRLGEEQPLLSLPLDYERPATPSHAGGEVRADIPQALAVSLRALARKRGHTLFMVILAAVAVVLSRYSGQSDIRIGAPNAGRNRKELEGLIGFFINTQVLRVEVDERCSFAELLDQVRVVVADAQSHQELPFEQLVDALLPERTLGYNPLFQFKINQNVAGKTSGSGCLGELEVESFPLGDGSARFDLAYDFTDTPDGIEASLTYAKDLFQAATIERLADSLLVTLEAFVAAPDSPLLDHPGHSISVRHGQNQTFPCTDFLALWQQGLQRGRGTVALRAGAREIGYEELEQESNRLACHLRGQGIRSGLVVACCQERSIDWVIGMLAVLKAGGIYLPLDSQQPVERLQQLLHDSGAVLLIHDRHDDRFSSLTAPSTLAYEPSSWEGADDRSISLLIDPEQPAYVIYTSGSTGQPKGVLISHRSLANYVQAVLERLQLEPDVSMAMVSTIAADLGHTMLFGALASGRLLHLLPQDLAFDPDGFAAYMAEHRVGVLKLVPSHLQGLLQATNPADVLPAHALLVGGETCPWGLVEKIRQLKPACRIVNHYGPTETTVGILTHEVCQRLDSSRSVPVGIPLVNCQAVILDVYLNPVAEQVAGELYLGGEGVAQGYLGRPALTAERFVPTGEGLRLYRTGDRARLVQDGLVEFVGRTDDQVKIRGYRVEPGEIGQVLMELPGVKEAVVLAQPLDSDPTRLQLVAYCSVEPGIRAEMLQQGLQQRLPDYMVPGQVVLLERLPLTANGKLDKRALPMPGAMSRGYVAPLGEIEEKLATVWAEVLKLERVGSTDNFFELGGDSILSLQIIARAKRQGIRVTPKQLFEKQTVGQLAQVAKLVEEKQAASITQNSAVVGSMPLLPIQSRFFELDIPHRHHWNQSVLLKSGTRIEPKPLLASLHTLVQHHDALRLRFSRQDGQWRADFRDQEDAQLLWQSELSDISELESLANEAQASLSLDQGPLLRAVLLALPDGQQRLLLIIHHLVVDGVSWRILLEDLHTAYGQAMQGCQLQLPVRTSSLQSWAEHLHTYAHSDALQVEQDYWLETLGEAIEELPRDNPEGRQSSRLARSVTVRLDAELTNRLLKQAPSAYRTQVNDLLLTALAQVLCQWSGQNSVLVQMEGHGREDLFEHLDLSRTVGWFSSLFPVRLTPRENLQQSIKAIKEQLRAVPNKGVGYGILRYFGSELCRTKMRQLPEARVTFNYLGQFDGSFSESDGARFIPAAESAGSSHSEDAPLGNWLSINGQVYGGELQLVWTFSQDIYRTETVEQLAKAYELALTDIVIHCSDEKNRGVTPSDFPLVSLAQAQLDNLPVPAGQIEDIYPLSPMQEGLLVHTLLEPNSGIYLMQYCYQVDHTIDHALFEQAWTMVVQRHSVLRTSFCWELGDQMVQIVHRDCRPDLRFLDWRDVHEADYERRLMEELEAELHTGFDLAREVPFRLRLIQLADARYGFVFSNHHILLDAWCRMGVVDEFFKLYSALTEGRDSRLPAPSLYRDFIVWLLRQDRQASGLFWKKQLAGFERPTGLPYDHLVARDRGASLIGDCLVALSEEHSQCMARTVQANQLTVNTLAQAAWALLLQRYSGDRDVLFGVTVAGRPVEFPEMQTTVGLFINSIPLRVRIPGAEANPIVRDWLQELLQYNLALREHEHIPLVDIQAQSEIGRGQSLFDSLFVFENAPIADSIGESAGDMRVSADSSRTHTNYPITVVVYPGSPLGLHLSYDQRYFEHATMERLLGDFKCLLLALMEGLERPFHELKWPRDLLGGVCDTTGTEPLPDVLRQGYARLVEGTMSHVPGHVAASYLDERWTYEDLDRNSRRLAQALQAKGIGVDSLVVVLAERGLPMFGMIMGVLRAGGGYLALDPALPKQRLAEILALSGVRMLVHGEAQKDLVGSLLEQTPVQSLSWSQVQNHACPLLPLKPGLADASHQLAYAIFTSGSTGTPKGVMVEQGGMLNNQLSKIPCFGLSECDVIAQTASQNFDISVWQLLTAALCGARVDIVPDAIVKDPEALLEHVRQVGITVLEVVPALIQGMLELPARALPSLRYLLTTGDAMAPELAARWLERYPHIPLINAYGPAECSDDVALHWIAAEDCRGIRLPVGRATAHNRLHVLNDLLEPMPGRATGELHVSGLGVGRGYIGDVRRTAEAFVPDPFSTVGGRLYRTGDLVLRRDGDEVLEYVGRADYQVKIRGFRIELGEIESRLQKHEALREVAVVDADFPSGKQLVAYVTAMDRSLITATTEQQHALWGRLRDFLRASLPDYMVPAHFVLLEKLPLTGNGKLDRKALAQIEVSQFQQSFVVPRNELESKVAEIWSQVLKVDRVGLTDNFFELGGDSIASVKVVARIKERLGLEVRLQDLMSLPRLMDFVEAIAESGSKQLIVKMNEYAGLAKPLFCLHPSYGTIYDYYPLAMALRDQAPVYGIACRSYAEGHWIKQSWEQVVDDYLREILSVESEGPYLLLGWSLGGNLALEISNRLERMGKRVVFVGWIDAPVAPRSESEPREMLDVPREDQGDAESNLLGSFCLIFPQFESEIRNFSSTLELSALPADRMTALEQWIDARLGDGMMSQIRSGLGEVDVQLVQEISRGFNTLLNDFQFGTGQSEITSWWAGKGAYEVNKEALEHLAKERLRESIIVDAYHDEITSHPVFIGTLREALARLAGELNDA